VAGAAVSVAAGAAAAADPPAPPPPTLSAAAEAQFQAILAKHGKRLSKAQQADLRRLVGEAQKTSADLRSMPLANAVEPALIFRPYLPSR
jgi:hypothetical protein